MPPKIARLLPRLPCRLKPEKNRLAKAMLLYASLGCCSSQAAAEESWQYVLVNPDGTQAAAPKIALSYPPVSNASPRQHLIIIEPEGGMPEPMILTGKTPGEATTPAPDAVPAAAEPQSPAAQAAAVRPPIRRAFKLF